MFWESSVIHIFKTGKPKLHVLLFVPIPLKCVIHHNLQVIKITKGKKKLRVNVLHVCENWSEMWDGTSITIPIIHG